MKKNILIFLIAVMLISITVVPFATTTTTPTPKEHNPVSAWAVNAVTKAGEVNILEEGRSYIFMNPITREEFCELIYNLIYTKDDVVSYDYDVKGITDTKNHKVLELYARDIVHGKTKTEFAPNDNLTREEAATIIERTTNNAIPVTRHMVYYMFKDEPEISGWAISGVQAVCNMGIMKGTGDDCFSPKEIFTVEEAITALIRIYDTYKANEAINTNSFADTINSKMPQDKNYMFSPLSIKLALLMAANGAYGETKNEILNTINVNDIEEYNNHVKGLIKTYSQSDLLKLSIANSIWINKDKTFQRFSSLYENKVKNIFDATSDIVDKSNMEEKINGWVKEKTNGKIPTIISKDNSEFWAMLINAVYFKGRWQSEFSKSATKEDIFSDKNNKDIKTLFMNKRAWIPYAKTDDVDIVKLSYLNLEEITNEKGEYVGTRHLKDMDISMYLMMSGTNFNPEYILNKSDFTSTYISLSVPKFSIEYSEEISEILKSSGINKAFNKTAEFESMFDKGNMWIDNVIHKTYIKVDEEGTEAAAVTSIGMAGSALPPEPIEIKFNKPFIFVIKDNINNEILFMGKLYEPNI